MSQDEDESHECPKGGYHDWQYILSLDLYKCRKCKRIRVPVDEIINNERQYK